MKDKEAISYLNNLKKGEFCTINIPLINDEVIPVTVMYMGMDKEGRYNFRDSGKFIMSKSFIEQKSISVEKKYDERVAMEIYQRIKHKFNRNFNNEKNR